MSYRELNAAADRLGWYLRSLGVGPEVLVGICLERSFDQVVAALAVWRAGGGFLPLDPAWPDARLRFLLRDAQAAVLISRGDIAQRLADRDRPLVDLDRDREAIARCPSRESAEIQPDDLAYLIYTSGSTGEPKGVEITHGNLLNLISWHQHAFGVTASDRASHLAGLGFDAAIWEVWPHLAAGASVVIVDDAVRTSSGLLQQWLCREGVTITYVPTPLAEPLLTAEWPPDTRLRYLLTGGEALHVHPRPGLPFAVVNNYGPTECTVVATSGLVPPCDRSDALPAIGRPIAGTQIRLLDERGEPVPDGQMGEICIGGASVGRGYRNRPRLTEQRFVQDRLTRFEGARLYRTGDLGCLLPDGQIAFRGRIDDQVKIRGHRVEPDEIAGALNGHPLVAASVVVVRDSGSAGEQLVAYVLPTAEEPSAEQLRGFLAKTLPEYMIPARFVRLASLPLTTSGKVDRTALPEPADENPLGQAGYCPPRSLAEQRLAEIIGDLLGRRVGADDNFFLIGGHSLLGTQVVLRARDAFAVELTLLQLFEAQTVARLAAVIERLLVEKLQTMSDEEAQLLAAD